MSTPLHRQRIEAVLAEVRRQRPATVFDLGCGDGALLLRLIAEPGIERVVGADHCAVALKRLREKLHATPPCLNRKVELVHGSIADLKPSAERPDMAILLETIEHIPPDRLSTVERAVFERIRPSAALVTTPNSDFNPLLGVPSHRRRHPDHRFEWGRARFRSWAEGVAGRSGYTVACRDLPSLHPLYGGPSQMAVFLRPAIGLAPDASRRRPSEEISVGRP